MELPTLSELAEDAMCVLSDLHDDDYLDVIEDYSDLDKVRLRYTSSDCDDFALALSVLMDWPVVGVASNKQGPLHRLNRSDDGRLVDVTGFVDEGVLRKRHKARDVTVTDLGSAWSSLGSDEDLRRLYATMLHLNTLPFTDSAFQHKITEWLRAGVYFDDEVPSPRSASPKGP